MEIVLVHLVCVLAVGGESALITVIRALTPNSLLKNDTSHRQKPVSRNGMFIESRRFWIPVFTGMTIPWVPRNFSTPC